MFSFSEEKLNPIIERCIKISIYYFRFSHRRIINILGNYNYHVEDLAIDAIAALFIAKGKEPMPIKKAFENWQPQIKTEEEFTFFLNKVVMNRVEQTIAKLLKESDPLYATILNSINYLIKKNKYRKSRYLGKVYIVESGSSTIMDKIVNQESFNLLPSYLFLDDKILLGDIFAYLEKNTNYYPAIPLNSLILKIKELKMSGYSLSSKTDSPTKFYEIDECIEQGLLAVKKQLHSFYLKKEKLTGDETQKFLYALKDISFDLKNGGVHPGLYDYLKPHFIELTFDDYKVKYHNILEYLFKVMRSTIAHELRR
jgi:hypothetical protein